MQQLREIVYIECKEWLAIKRFYMMQPFVLPKLLLLFVHTGQLFGLLLTSVVCEHTTWFVMPYMESHLVC